MVAPPSGTRDTGWLTAAEPPHSYFNFLQRGYYRWLEYLKNLEITESLTWVLGQVFSAGITVNQSTTNATAVTATGNGTAPAVGGFGSAIGTGAGGRFVGGLAATTTVGEGTGAIVEGSGNHSYGLLATTTDSVGVGGAAIRAIGSGFAPGVLAVSTDGAGVLSQSLNAPGLSASSYADNGVLGSSNSAVGVKGTGAGSAAVEGNSGATNTPSFKSTGTSAVAMEISNAAPSPTAALGPCVTRVNVTRAFCLVQMNGTSSPTILAGQNIGSVVALGTSLALTMATPANTTNLVGRCTLSDSLTTQAPNAYQLLTTNTVVSFRLRNAAGASLNWDDPLNSGLRASIEIMGD